LLDPNYAARAGEDGLEYPGDACTLLSALYTATQRMPQLLAQLAAFLDREKASGRLGDANGGDPAEHIRSALDRLLYAETDAGNLTARLRSAQNAISGLYFEDGTERGSGG